MSDFIISSSIFSSRIEFLKWI